MCLNWLEELMSGIKSMSMADAVEISLHSTLCADACCGKRRHAVMPSDPNAVELRAVAFT